MKVMLTIAATALMLATAGCGEATSGAPNDANPSGVLADREVLFSDEFNGPDLDRTKWNVMGTDFWVNEELQAYLDSPDTITIAQDIEGADGGALVLRPVFRPGEDTRADRNADFLSGRVNTRGKFDFTHGRAEARIKMPDAVGVWPAFWLLGNGQWPDTGEIDIMEYVGEREWTAVALHGPGYSGETPIVNRFVFPEGQDATQWHTYAAEWTKDAVQFEIDGRVTYRATRKMVDVYGEWRFDTPKFAILNFAVGGAYPVKNNGVKEPYYGMPVETAERIKAGEIAMEIDWVRIYAPE